MNGNAGRGFLKAIIIVGLIFVVAYFYSYNKWLDHDFNSVDITYRYEDEQGNGSNTNTETNKTDVSNEFKDKYESLNYEIFEANFGEEFYDIFFENGKITDEFYIYLGVVNFIKYDAAVNSNYKMDITSSELKTKINSIVGNVNYTDKSFTTKNGYLTINYNSDLGKYSVSVNNKKAGIDYKNGGIKTAYHGAQKDDKYLYLYEKAYYLNITENKSGVIEYNYHEGLNNNSKIIAYSPNNFDLNAIPTYEFKFSINNNIYTLESISKK